MLCGRRLGRSLGRCGCFLRSQGERHHGADQQQDAGYGKRGGKASGLDFQQLGNLDQYGGTDAPGREEDAVVHAEVFHPPAILGEGGEERQVGAVVEDHEGDQQGDKQRAGICGQAEDGGKHQHRLEGEHDGQGGCAADFVRDHPGDQAPGGVADRHDDNDQEGQLVHARLGHPFGAADDHQPGAGAEEKAQPQGIEATVLEDLPRRDVGDFRRSFGSAGCSRIGDKVGGWVGDQQRQAADHYGEADAEIHHRLLQADTADHPGGERSDIDRGEAEAGDDDTGNQTGLGWREPLQRRRSGRRIAETDAESGENAEADDPGPVTGGLGDPDEAGADQQAAEDAGDLRAELVLQLAGQNHRHGKRQAGHRIGVVDGRRVPVEGTGATGADGIVDRAFKDTPGVQNTERQVDAGTGQCDCPAAFCRDETAHSLLLVVKKHLTEVVVQVLHSKWQRPFVAKRNRDRCACGG